MMILLIPLIRISLSSPGRQDQYYAAIAPPARS